MAHSESLRASGIARISALYPALVNHAAYGVDGPTGFDRGERGETE
jgi:hypothetical protein